jgi:hypothetical protein
MTPRLAVIVLMVGTYAALSHRPDGRSSNLARRPADCGNACDDLCILDTALIHKIRRKAPVKPVCGLAWICH